jgi:hypothetical protein
MHVTHCSRLLRRVVDLSHWTGRSTRSSPATFGSRARNAKDTDRVLDGYSEALEEKESLEGEKTVSSEGHSSSQTLQGVGSKKELAGPKGPEPTRYGDWERAGRCSDF